MSYDANIASSELPLLLTLTEARLKDPRYRQKKSPEQNVIVLPIIEVWSCAQLPVVTLLTVNCGILRSVLRSTGFILFHSRISSLVVFETAINIKREMISEHTVAI